MNSNDCVICNIVEIIEYVCEDYCRSINGTEKVRYFYGDYVVKAMSISP